MSKFLTLCTLVLLVASSYGYYFVERRQETLKGCGSTQADIVFILDESGSIYPDQFANETKFVKDVIDLFPLGPDHIEVGVMIFANDAKVLLNLGQFKDKDEIKKALDDYYQQGGGTDTNEALQMYREEELPQHARPGVPQLGIVITDGASSQPAMTLQEADRTKAAGVTLIAVGVGSEINKDELESIASDTSLVFVVDDFAALQHLKDRLAWQACEAMTTTTTTQPPQMIQGCSGHQPIDVIFGMPDQAGILQTAKTLEFIGTLVEPMELSAIQVRVGLSPRECSAPNQPILLREHDSKEGFDLGLNGRLLTGTKTDLQIEYLRAQGFLTSSGAREDSAKVAILIVDNKSLNSEAAKEEAKLAMDACIQLVVIGVGEFVDEEELKALAYNDESYFTVPGYGALKKLEQTILNRVCRGIEFDAACEKGMMLPAGPAPAKE